MRQENLTKIREKVVTKIGDEIFALDFSPELVNFCSLKLVTKTLPFNSDQNRWTFYVLKISPFLVASTYNVASIYEVASTYNVASIYNVASTYNVANTYNAASTYDVASTYNVACI